MPAKAHTRLAFLALWIPYALLVQRFWFVTDDAYISFRYARNWANGLGLRYNAGDHRPVEGYSNFLLVAYAALVERLGLDVTFWVPLLTFVAGSLLLYLVFRALRAQLRVSPLSACLASASLGCSVQYAVWSTGGLETMLYALFLFAAFERLVLRREGIDAVGGGALALLAALTRVEGIGWALALVPLAAASRRARSQPAGRPLAIYAAIVVSGYAVYFAWRYAHFGMALSMTTHAKVHFGADGFARGLRYVGTQFVESLSLLVIVPGLFVAARAGRRALALPTAAVALGFVLYSVLVGGDFMAFGRFLVPMLPFLALLTGWAAEDITVRGHFRTGVVAGTALIVLAVLPSFDVRLVPDAVRDALRFRDAPADGPLRSEHAQWRKQRDAARSWAIKGRALGVIAQAGDSAVMAGIGAAGYYSGLFVYDRFGLVTPQVTERPASERFERVATSSPGHDGLVPPAYFLAIEPTFLRDELLRPETRRQLVDHVAYLENALTADGTGKEYVVDFYGIAGSARFLVVCRRIPRDVAPEEAWRELERALNRYLRTGKVLLVDIEDGAVSERPETP